MQLTREQQAALPRNVQMEESLEPVMFKFEKPGAWLAGELLQIEAIEIKGKLTNRYVVATKAGLYQFLGTYQIEKKLRKEHVGGWCLVEFLGENKEVKTQGSPMHEFKVLVEPAKNAHGYRASDDDVRV